MSPYNEEKLSGDINGRHESSKAPPSMSNAKTNAICTLMTRHYHLGICLIDRLGGGGGDDFFELSSELDN